MPNLLLRQGMLDNRAVLENRAALLNSRVPMLDYNAALDNMGQSYCCHAKARFSTRFRLISSLDANFRIWP
jgi:hypothetical protein